MSAGEAAGFRSPQHEHWGASGELEKSQEAEPANAHGSGQEEWVKEFGLRVRGLVCAGVRPPWREEQQTVPALTDAP